MSRTAYAMICIGLVVSSNGAQSQTLPAVRPPPSTTFFRKVDAEGEWNHTKYLGDQMLAPFTPERARALEELERTHSILILQLGLYNDERSFGASVARALERIGSSEAVPFLIRALQCHNYVAENNGGTDEVMVEMDFRKAMVAAVESLTLTPMDITNYDDPGQMARALARIEAWEGRRDGHTAGGGYGQE